MAHSGREKPMQTKQRTDNEAALLIDATGRDTFAGRMAAEMRRVARWYNVQAAKGEKAAKGGRAHG